MAIKPYKRPDSEYWWVRGVHQGITIYRTTQIPHEGKKRAPPVVNDYVRSAEMEIEALAKMGRDNWATFADAAEIYLRQGGSPRFLEKIVDVMGHVLIRDISQEMLYDIAEKIYPNCAPQTINRQFFTPFIAVWSANSIGQHSICPPARWKRLAINRRGRNGHSKTVTYEQAWQILDACNSAVRQIMFFLFYTGCRPIEAILLEAEDVDIDGRWIVLRDTKTGIPRGIPIHSILLPMLAELKERGGRIFRSSKGDPWPDNRVYNSEGRIIEQRGGQFQTMLRTVTRKTGIHITPYMARHTVSTYLIYPGGVEKVIKDQILGHGEARDVSVDYIHLPRRALIDAIEVLPAKIGRAHV